MSQIALDFLNFTIGQFPVVNDKLGKVAVAVAVVDIAVIGKIVRFGVTDGAQRKNGKTGRKRGTERRFGSSVYP